MAMSAQEWARMTQLAAAQQQAMNMAGNRAAGGGGIQGMPWAIAGTTNILMAAASLASKPVPTAPLPVAGMKVEDLIGWRIWRVRNDHLWSYSADYAWMPGDVSEGDPGDHDSAGVWAFKDKRRAFQKAIENGHGFVWGSVRLWGHVVEHRDGYRASKARIVSIDGATRDITPETMADLCRLYRVPEIEVAPRAVRAPIAPEPIQAAQWIVGPGSVVPFGELPPLAEPRPTRVGWPILATLVALALSLAGLGASTP